MSPPPVITILGASGFLGRNLLRHLRTLPFPEGTTLRLASRSAPPPPPQPPTSSLIELPISCDITSPHDLNTVLQGATHAVNLVGILHQTPPRTTFQSIQAQAPAHIAEAISNTDISTLVHVSAIGADSSSASAYAQTKAAGEKAVSTLVHHDVDVTILRPSIVFGPDDAFFNRFATIARFSPFLPLVGGGHTRFQPVHVDDVAHAISLSLGLPYTHATSDTTTNTSASHAASTTHINKSSSTFDTSTTSNHSHSPTPTPQPVKQPVNASSTARKVSMYELGGASVHTFRGLMELLFQATGQRRALLPMPFFVASAQGMLFETLHAVVPAVPPMLTRDQVTLLRRDNVVTPGAATLADLGITPQPCDLETIAYAKKAASGQS